LSASALQPAPRVYRVAEITRLVRNAIETALPDEIHVLGEISNLRIPGSGHGYFTLKDDQAQISAVIWRSDLSRLGFIPKDGMQVHVTGRLTVYERGGNYQLIVRVMQAAGVGALYAAFLKLKQKLEAEGLFDPARKRPLPLLPRHVAIVTSPTGAALRDILRIIDRRFPTMHITIAPARVQGDGAAAEIAAAIALLNRRGDCDVIIVGRGGGSLEDLWCFNEEVVARAIAASAIPVISAVGHETDFTISDFVADVRAPTPSAAAEIVVNRKADFDAAMVAARARMRRSLADKLQTARARLRALRDNYILREPRNIVALARSRLKDQRRRMVSTLDQAWRESQQTIDDRRQRMRHSVTLARERADGRMRQYTMQLRSLNPYAVLERGYSITRFPDGRVVRRADGLRPGELVETRLGRGGFTAEVKVIDEKKE